MEGVDLQLVTTNFSGQNLATLWQASLLCTTPNSLIHLDILC